MSIVVEPQLQCPEGPESLTSRDVLPLETDTPTSQTSPAHSQEDRGQESNIPGTAEEVDKGSVKSWAVETDQKMTDQISNFRPWLTILF